MLDRRMLWVGLIWFAVLLFLVRSARRQRALLVEGNIGVGKSTYVTALAAQTDFKLVPETIGARFLSAFYTEPHVYGFALQMTQHITRAILLVRAQSEYQTTLLDRSIVGDYAFALWNYASGNLTARAWALYQEQAGASIAEALQRYDADKIHIVFLHDDAQACSDRQRARGDAADVPLSYLQGIEAAHLIVLSLVPAKYNVTELHWDEFARRPAPLPRPTPHRRSTLPTRAREACDALESPAREHLLAFYEAGSAGE